MQTSRWCIVGPTHPFRGGIPRHTTLLTNAASAAGLDVSLVTFVRQYPRWLYKGASDLDPDQLQPATATPDRRLDTLNPATWRRTAHAIAAASPDVVVTVWWHPFFAPVIGSLHRGLRRRAPGAIRTALCHNVLPHESSAVDRILVRRALSTVDGIVVHSASQREIARELLGDVPVLVTPHPTYAVDLQRDDTGDRRGDGPVTLLFFGLVRQYKGVDVLLRALPAVLRQRRVRLVVAGEFWDPVAPYTALIEALGLDDHVDLRPAFVPDAELRQLLREVDLVVAPYVSATQSGVVEMAFGAGIPVVASRVGGLGEQVDDGFNGLLVPPDDVPALAEALVTATEPTTLARLTKGAQSDSTVRTWESLVADIDRFTVAQRAARGGG